MGYTLTLAFSAGTFFSFLGGAPYIATKVYELNSVVSGLVMGFPAAGYFLEIIYQVGIQNFYGKTLWH